MFSKRSIHSYVKEKCIHKKDMLLFLFVRVCGLSPLLDSVCVCVCVWCVCVCVCVCCVLCVLLLLLLLLLLPVCSMCVSVCISFGEWRYILVLTFLTFRTCIQKGGGGGGGGGEGKQVDMFCTQTS